MEGGRMYTVDLYLRVRLACHVDGLSQREAASRFGIARETVRKMLRHSEPPGYRRRQPPKRPKLAPFIGAAGRGVGVGLRLRGYATVERRSSSRRRWQRFVARRRSGPDRRQCLRRTRYRIQLVSRPLIQSKFSVDLIVH